MDLDKIKKSIKLYDIDTNIAVLEIQDFIVKQIVGAGKQGGVLGLSGGIDSTTVAFLTKKAFDKYNGLNPNGELKLYGLIMPSNANHPDDLRDAIDVVKSLGIEYDEISLEPIIGLFSNILGEKIGDEYNKGNLSSEIRAVILSRYAAAKNCLILGTGNRDEDYALGYFTKRGDGQVDISPIGELSKRHVRQVAAYLGVSDKLVNREPTAGLWKGQTDENELGFSYLEAEVIIAGKDQGYSRDDLKKITDFGKVRKDNEKNIDIVDKILDMHVKNKFKMEMPPVAKVTKK